MNGPDISFTLRANSAAFTKGVAQASNSIKGLRKELREGEVGAGIKRLLGAGAIIEGFRAVINHAQDVRNAFEEMGKPISETTDQIAKMGDSIDDLKKGAMTAGTTVLGFFTNVGSKLGQSINDLASEFFGRKQVDSKVADAAERAADKLEAERDKKLKDFMQRNSHDELAKKDKEIADARRKYAQEGMNADEKRNALLREMNTLMAQRLALENAPTRDQSKIDENIKAQIEKAGEIRKANTDVETAEGKKHDKYRPDLIQLSNAQITEGMDPAKRKAIMDARSVLQLEAQADQQGFAGNLKGSDLTMARANQLRQGLSGFVKSDEVNKDKDFTQPIVDAVNSLKDEAKRVVLVY